MNSINDNVPEAEYFAEKALSNSVLSRMNISPAHCKHYMDNPKEQTPNMLLGSVFHKLTLEGQQAFEESYHIELDTDPKMPRRGVVKYIIASMLDKTFSDKFFLPDTVIHKPRGEAAEIAETLMTGEDVDIKNLFIPIPTDINRRSKEGKAQYQEFLDEVESKNLIVVRQESLDKACEYVNYLAEVDGREVISDQELYEAKNYISFLEFIGNRKVVSQEMYDTAIAMRDSVLAHPVARQLLSFSGVSEATLYWIDPDTGQKCKARVDRLLDSGVMLDLKSTTDAHPERFAQKAVARFNYHQQEAFYSNGYRAVFERDPQAFYFIAVESKAPHAVSVVELDQSSKEIAKAQVHELKLEYSECATKGQWPAYSDEIEQVSLPNWMHAEYETALDQEIF